MEEPITIEGLTFYKNGTLIGKSGKEIGQIGVTGEIVFTFPDSKQYMKLSIAICALFKNNGKFPNSVRDWKITYLDGNKLNCSVDNLEFTDIKQEDKKTVNLRYSEEGLVISKEIKELQKKLSEKIKEACDISYNIGYKRGYNAGQKEQRAALKAAEQAFIEKKRNEEILEKYNRKTTVIPKETVEPKKVILPKIEKKEVIPEVKETETEETEVKSPEIKDKRKARKPYIETSDEIYLIDIAYDDYTFTTYQDVMEKFGYSFDKVKKLCNNNKVFEKRYCLTKNIGDIWYLQDEYRSLVI